MLRVLGSRKQLCDGLTRRDLLHVGALSLFGMGSELLNLSAPRGVRAASNTNTPAGSSASFGRARSCILLFLYGSPSQLETFDPKPTAPSGIRGDLGGAISTVLPGVSIGEGLPKLSKVLDRASIIRSMSHPHPIHGVAYALTGNPQITVPMELSPRDPGHWPFIGSVVEYRDAQRSGAAPCEVPPNLVLPWAFSSHRVGEVARAGPYGGFLGQGFDPISVEFSGRGTKKATKALNELAWNDYELYRGVTAESRFRLTSGLDPALSSSATLDRLHQRRSLLDQMEDLRRELDSSTNDSGIDRHRALAHRLLESDTLRRAFELGEEPERVRERYGMTLFGQAALTARRLVEAGGRFVTVFWDEFGLAGTGWDTHWDHYARMKEELLPGLDQSLSGLLLDLDERGILDETLVLCLSEHGRTPKITPGRGGGRDHWSRCYSVLLAGGGIGRGRVLGRSDRIASDPVEDAVSPKDVLATAYHLLGIDPESTLVNRQGQLLPLVPHGRILTELL